MQLTPLKPSNIALTLSLKPRLSIYVKGKDNASTDWSNLNINAKIVTHSKQQWALPGKMCSGQLIYKKVGYQNSWRIHQTPPCRATWSFGYMSRKLRVSRPVNLWESRLQDHEKCNVLLLEPSFTFSAVNSNHYLKKKGEKNKHLEISNQRIDIYWFHAL